MKKSILKTISISYIILIISVLIGFVLFRMRQNSIREFIREKQVLKGLGNNPDSHKSEYEIKFESMGLSFEEHKIKTSDGYINTAWRLRNLDAIKRRNKTSNPIILNHGLLDNCYSFLALGREKSLTYILVDEGYDVWLTNNRGSLFSFEHIDENKDSFSLSSDYWDFSLHELANHDLIAHIDYIKKRTNSNKVDFIGHSQGGFQVLLSYTLNKEYLDESIGRFISLGTVPNFVSINRDFPLIIHNSGLLNFIDTIGVKNIMSVHEHNTQIFSHFCVSFIYNYIG